MVYDAIIIGGGAAGLFCASRAAARGLKVVVLEGNAVLGRKIGVSGGGRCNFTNRRVGPENFVSQNPHFARSALTRYTPDDFVQLVREYRIDYYEKKLGQLFCRGRAQEITDMLLSECRRYRAEVKTSCIVSSVTRSDLFSVQSSLGSLEAKNVVVACGGLSFAKLGATDLGYRIARSFGCAIVPTRPSLVALVMDGRNREDLAGVSIDSEVSNAKQSFRENILFTHRGMSGPAILQISNYWERSSPINIDLMPAVAMESEFSEPRNAGKTAAQVLLKMLPAKFVRSLRPEALYSKRIDQLSKQHRRSIINNLQNWQVSFSGTEGYDRAEVTLGGVSTAEISSKTMESTRVAGLYFIGEVVDVTGWLGGYNFQWAWSSAHAAAASILK
jgi:predicted Rossmann fold flavoprotein